MSSLISIRTNILYAKKSKENEFDKDEYVKHQELIFLVDKPTYRYSNEGEVIRERGIDEVRVTVTESSMDQLIILLTKLKDVTEKDLS